MKKLRILFAGHLPPYHGGIATIHAVVLKSLAARGHSIRVISHITSADAAAGDWFAAANPCLRIRRFEVPSYIPLTTLLTAPEREAQRVAFAGLISAECAADKPDVLLLGNTLASGTNAAAQARIPQAMFVHGGTLYRMRQRLGPEEELAVALDQYRAADHLIAVAGHLGPQLNELGLRRHSVIPNTVDTQEFKPRRKSVALLESLGIAAGDIVVAHFSNLKSSVKRPLDFVEAAGIALARNPRLLFVAAGDGEWREVMETRCAQLGIAGRFRFPGWIRSDRMPEYYSICDAVAMPSESEARSMVFLETQASGRVLIATDIAASRESVENGVTGLLFPVGSSGILAQRILTVAGDPALREAIGRQAREAAEERPLAAYGASLERTLKDLVERGPAVHLGLEPISFATRR